ncbi:hypothetical protein BC829DRAFT_422439, partial [Chytridium lagenaria]
TEEVVAYQSRPPVEETVETVVQEIAVEETSKSSDVEVTETEASSTETVTKAAKKGFFQTIVDNVSYAADVVGDAVVDAGEAVVSTSRKVIRKITKTVIIDGVETEVEEEIEVDEEEAIETVTEIVTETVIEETAETPCASTEEVVAVPVEATVEETVETVVQEIAVEETSKSSDVEVTETEASSTETVTKAAKKGFFQTIVDNVSYAADVVGDAVVDAGEAVVSTSRKTEVEEEIEVDEVEAIEAVTTETLTETVTEIVTETVIEETAETPCASTEEVVAVPVEATVEETVETVVQEIAVEETSKSSEVEVTETEASSTETVTKATKKGFFQTIVDNVSYAADVVGDAVVDAGETVVSTSRKVIRRITRTVIIDGVETEIEEEVEVDEEPEEVKLSTEIIASESTAGYVTQTIEATEAAIDVCAPADSVVVTEQTAAVEVTETVAEGTICETSSIVGVADKTVKKGFFQTMIDTVSSAADAVGDAVVDASEAVYDAGEAVSTKTVTKIVVIDGVETTVDEEVDENDVVGEDVSVKTETRRKIIRKVIKTIIVDGVETQVEEEVEVDDDIIRTIIVDGVETQVEEEVEVDEDDEDAKVVAVGKRRVSRKIITTTIVDGVETEIEEEIEVDEDEAEIVQEGAEVTTETLDTAVGQNTRKVTRQTVKTIVVDGVETEVEDTVEVDEGEERSVEYVTIHEEIIPADVSFPQLRFRVTLLFPLKLLKRQQPTQRFAGESFLQYLVEEVEEAATSASAVVSSASVAVASALSINRSRPPSPVPIAASPAKKDAQVTVDANSCDDIAAAIAVAVEEKLEASAVTLPPTETSEETASDEAPATPPNEPIEESFVEGVSGTFTREKKPRPPPSPPHVSLPQAPALLGNVSSPAVRSKEQAPGSHLSRNRLCVRNTSVEFLTLRATFSPLLVMSCGEQHLQELNLSNQKSPAGTDAEQAFARAFRETKRKIELLLFGIPLHTQHNI